MAKVIAQDITIQLNRREYDMIRLALVSMQQRAIEGYGPYRSEEIGRLREDIK